MDRRVAGDGTHSQTAGAEGFEEKQSEAQSVSKGRRSQGQNVIGGAWPWPYCHSLALPGGNTHTRGWVVGVK